MLIKKENKICTFLLFILQLNVFGQNTTVTLTTSRDLSLGYHDLNSTENTNYDWAPQSAAFTIPGHAGGVNSNRALIDFDLSSIPTGATIVEATLDLYALTNTMNTPFVEGHIGENASILQRVTTSWNTNTTTWNRQPTNINTNQVLIPTSASSSQDS